MKILFLSPFVPYPLNRGTNQRIFNFIKEAASKHSLFLFCLSANSDDMDNFSVFKEFCQEVVFEPIMLSPWKSFFEKALKTAPDTIEHWYSPDIHKKLVSLISSHDFDLIHCEDICMAYYLRDMDLSIPVITDRNRVDLEFQLEKESLVQGFLKSISYGIDMNKLKKFERSILERFKYQIVCSGDDYKFLKSNFGIGDNVVIIRNGIDENYFFEMEKSASFDVPIISFTGAMDYLPNKDAMMWFMEEIYEKIKSQIGRFKLFIAGINPGDEIKSWAQRYQDVIVTGRVEDIRQYYADCDVYICPIRIGGGTRLKIVEAMVMNKAVVSTTIGAQGLDLIDDEHILLADTADSFADKVSELIRDRNRSFRIARVGRDFVLDNFTWSKLGNQLDDFYKFCVAESKNTALSGGIKNG